MLQTVGLRSASVFFYYVEYFLTELCLFKSNLCILKSELSLNLISVLFLPVLTFFKVIAQFTSRFMWNVGQF